MQWALAGLAVVLLAAPAQAQAVSAPAGAAPATLHIHPLDWSDFPITTQDVPFGGWDEVPVQAGLTTQTLSCAPGGLPLANTSQEYHEWHGYSSPGFVEYAFKEGGRPRTAPERQMGYNGSLAGPQVVLHWFLQTTTGAPSTGAVAANDAPLVVPNVAVDAVLRASADAVSPDDKAYGAGPVLAEGRSAPATLAMDQSQGANHTMAGGHHVYEIAVPMAVKQAAIGSLGYTLLVRARLDNPACPASGKDVMPNLVAPYADAEHRPRLELQVDDPLRILSLAPEFSNGTVLVRAQAQSVWGNHDVQVGPAWTPYDAAPNVTLSVDGPGGHRKLQPAAVVQRVHEWLHHADPVDMTWAFDRANLTAGTYWLNLTVTNLQRTATATAHAAFTLGPDAAYPALPGGAAPQVDQRRPEAPALPLPLLAAGLAIAASARRPLNKR